MLRVGAAIAVPAIVGNVYQHLRARFCELTDLVRENGFVADEDAKLLVSSLDWKASCARAEITDLFGQASGKAENLLERQVLPEWNQMHFVVAANPLARGADDGSRIEHTGLVR